MRTRSAWFAFLVVLAVQGTARSDFVAFAKLTGDGESPSTGVGSGVVTYIAAKDELIVSLAFSGLESPTTIPAGVPGAAHIHFGTPPPPGGPILFPFIKPYANDFPIGVTSGSYSTTLTAASLLPDPANGINTFAQAVLAIEEGHTYFNIHTVKFPGGEIAGQIVVPEPASLTLLALGLGGVLAFARFGRRRAA